MSTIAPTPASNESTQVIRQYALDYMDEELEKLLAMAQVLVNELEPQDPKNLKDSDRPTAWRLAEVLYERLSDANFSNTMRALVLGKQD